LNTKSDLTEFSITNQGPVISKDNIARIFDPFVRDGNSGGQKGSGLGLSLCASIIKAHDGQIAVVSENDETTFSFTLR